MDYRTITDKYYPQGTPLGVIYNTHCRAVADLACRLIDSRGLPVSREEAFAASMLHDIGIFLCNAPSIGCHGKEPYILHGPLGADLLREEGIDEKYARVAERHTGSGITEEEARRLGFPAGRSYLPETTLERLICYADKFFSKSGASTKKSLDEVRAGMARFGEEALTRFDALHDEFGFPHQNC